MEGQALRVEEPTLQSEERAIELIVRLLGVGEPLWHSELEALVWSLLCEQRDSLDSLAGRGIRRYRMRLDKLVAERQGMHLVKDKAV
jgi:hypothetical protein